MRPARQRIAVTVVPMPALVGSASMNCPIRSAEVTIASSSAVSSDSVGRSSESSSASVAIAVELASSPAA